MLQIHRANDWFSPLNLARAGTMLKGHGLDLVQRPTHGAQIAGGLCIVLGATVGAVFGDSGR